MTTRLLVAALLVRDGRALLARRTPRRTWYPSLWDLPGGAVEDGEDERDAVLREVHEELRVRAERPDGDPLAVMNAPGVRLSVWRISAWSGDVRNAAPREHDALRWCAPDELAELPLAHPEYRELLPGALAP